MTDDKPTIEGWTDLSVEGGKRTNIAHSETLTDWYVGYGKDQSCEFEGSWYHMMILAARILSSDNSRKVVETVEDLPDDFYQPELRDLAEEAYQYSGTPYDFEEDGETEETHYHSGGFW